MHYYACIQIWNTITRLNTGHYIFIVGFAALIIAIIRIMEMIKIKNVHGKFATTDQGSRFILSADIVYTGFTNIDITDIKVQINGTKKMYCFLEGEIVPRNDNNTVVFSTGALIFSNKYNPLEKPNISPFHITLNSDKRHLKIFYTYLSTDYIFTEENIKAILTIKTDPNIFIKLLNLLTLWLLSKRKYKFVFERTEEINLYENFEIPLLIEEK